MCTKYCVCVCVCVCVCSDAKLLVKYFQQLDEIETLKEQLKCREKKIRRLEDQLRIFSRMTTPSSTS